MVIERSYDTELVASLTLEAWRSSVDHRSSGQRFTADDVSALFLEGAAAFVARNATGEPVGSVIAVPDGPGCMELTKLAVVGEGERRLGTGSKLVEFAVDFAESTGCREMVLAVSLYQPNLCRYYANRGFVVRPGRIYRHASPLAPRPIVMVRPLSPKNTDRASAAPGAADPIGDASAALLAGCLVILPTETVYGLGALASNPVAVRRVFATKGRPVDHPLIVHVAHRSAMSAWAVDVPDDAWRLAEQLWPGPLTLVLAKAPWVPDEVTGGLSTVALRVPRHPDALAVLGLLPVDAGIAAPSANRFGRVSPTTAADAWNDLEDHLTDGDLVVDGGPCEVGVESTILDLTTETPMLLRPGGCSVEEIERVLGRTIATTPSGPSRAPGMLPAHYAPLAGVLVTKSTDLARVVATEVEQGRSVGVLAPVDQGALPANVERFEAPDPYTGDTVAPILYARLRQADRLGLDILVVVAPDSSGLGLAVNDRLKRAEYGSRRT